MAPSPRSVVTGALLVLLLASCSRSGPPATVASGSPTTDPTSTANATAVADEGASPVSGVSPAALREAVEQPSSSASRSLHGPVAERVVLADGRALWRVRIPGPFAARSARVSVQVGDRSVGAGIVTPDLASLVAVTSDGAGLVSGAAVSFRWEGQAPSPAGTLAVAR